MRLARLTLCIRRALAGSAHGTQTDDLLWAWRMDTLR